MKTHKVLFLALIVSAAFALSAQAGDRHRSNGNAKTTGSAPAHYSGGSAVRSGGNVRFNGGRTFASSPRMTVRSMPQFSQRHFGSGGNTSFVPQQRFARRTFNSERTGGGNAVPQQFTRRTFNSERTGGNGLARFGNNNRNLGTIQGTGGNRFSNNNRGFNRTGTGAHVFARRAGDWHRDWDRHSDHWWNRHRCRWVNNSWFIFDFGFVPWYGWSYYDSYPYDYYPYSYGAYGYDPGVYDQSAYYDQGGYNYNGQSNYYDQGNSNSYDQGGNGLGSNERSAAAVADVQDQLARAGYYHGKIDGVLGPETRHALVRYQSDKGLRMTGSLTTETRRSLGLGDGTRGYGQASDE